LVQRRITSDLTLADVSDLVPHVERFLTWVQAQPDVGPKVSSWRLETELYPRFATETGEPERAWRGIPEALKKLRVSRRQKRLPDGSRPVVYTIPRRRRAKVVQLDTARRAG
jgi:hypothetical protein